MTDNNSVDFNSILDTQTEEIKSKPPMPIGSYNFRIKGLEHITSSQKKTPGIEFTVVPYEAMEDVNQEELAAAGGLGTREMPLTFYVTADSASMVKDFLTAHCGIEGSGKTLRQVLAEAVNQTFRGIITHKLSTKSGRNYAEISQTMRIE
jgi:hypothetical protein